VSGFDVALKIVLVSIIPFDMLQQAVFPTISRTRDKVLLKNLLIYSFVIGIIFMVFIHSFSNELLSLFGGQEMIKYSDVLKTLSIITPFVAVTFILGTCTLVSFGFYKEFNLSLIWSSIAYILIVLILWIFNKVTLWNLIYLRVFSDIVLVGIRVYYTIKRKILFD
jgi:PST family polysaccharide transporter